MKPYPSPIPPENAIFLRLDLAGTADAVEIRPEPVSLLLKCDGQIGPAEVAKIQNPRREHGPFRIAFQILARDTPERIDAHPLAQTAQRVDLSRWVAVPGLVNAHTHLDLTAIGHQPFDPKAPFADWLGMVVSRRPRAEAEIRASVEKGVAHLLAGGVVAVGDIVGCPPSGMADAGALALAASGLLGTAFCEFFAMGSREAQSLEALDRFIESLVSRWPVNSPVRLGLSPHAPYSVSPSAYQHAVRIGAAHRLAIATHLAESLDERLFIATAQGPQRAFLERLGLWSQSLLGVFGQGLHPIEHTLPVLDHAYPPTLVVHVNDLAQHDPVQRDRLAQLLVASGTQVVYCPHASAYFGAHEALGPHPYRDLLNAGVPVSLGTDSIINLPVPPPNQASTISTWHEAKLLVKRDGLEPLVAMDLITTAGAKALGLDPERFTLTEGVCPAGLSLIPASDWIVSGRSKDGAVGPFFVDEPPILLLIGT